MLCLEAHSHRSHLCISNDIKILKSFFRQDGFLLMTLSMLSRPPAFILDFKILRCPCVPSSQALVTGLLVSSLWLHKFVFQTLSF